MLAIQRQLSSNKGMTLLGGFFLTLMITGFLIYRNTIVVPKANAKLMEAVQNNGEIGVQDALREGADVNTHNEHGATPLHVAINQKNSRMVDILLDAGADINVRAERNVTPLAVALCDYHLPIAKRLIERGADINLRFDMGEGREVSYLNAFVSRRRWAAMATLFGPTGETEFVFGDYLAICSELCTRHIVLNYAEKKEISDAFQEALNNASSPDKDKIQQILDYVKDPAVQ